MTLARSAPTDSNPPTFDSLEGGRHIALVFDDGPIAGRAQELLTVFAEAQIPVTFAYVGKNVEAHLETAQAAIRAGHEIVNHSYSHAHPGDLDDAALEQEILAAQKAIPQTTGRAPQWYWPPYLELDDRVHAAAKKAGIAVYEPKNLVWSQDWDRTISGEEIKQRATSGIEDGAVIIFHEWRNETLTELPAILAELKRQNCVFLTFTALAAYVRRSAEKSYGA